MKINNIPIGYKKVLKAFSNGRAKIDQSEHIIRDGNFNTKELYMVIEGASEHTLKKFAAKCCINYQLLVNNYTISQTMDTRVLL